MKTSKQGSNPSTYCLIPATIVNISDAKGGKLRNQLVKYISSQKKLAVQHQGRDRLKVAGLRLPVGSIHLILRGKTFSKCLK